MYTVDRLFRPAVNATVDRPLDHLVACHGRIEERLATLERAGEVLETRREEALGAIDACFRYFETNGVRHTEDEEESTFPRMMPRLTPVERDQIERLERQHREADSLYGELKEAVEQIRAGQDSGAITRYRDAVSRFSGLYREHIEWENRELMAMARRVLSGDDLGQISVEMRKRRGLE